ncbi:hypothetical protein BSU04_24380 [Caballeronia sordidicola]|uniref:Uncharacterized protein n=1 Tax=Caballeronia sordidicola TaxID=196367 RepID=A0A226WXB2_CABSO|nr:hypothetical protein BSU04_24380 [Caballeronia sordidicola]
MRRWARTVMQRFGFRVWHRAGGSIGRLAILGWPHCIGLNFRDGFVDRQDYLGSSFLWTGVDP